MNCAVHTDTPATAYCRTCGKALCENCKRDVMGAIYCEPCIAVRLQGNQPPAVPLGPPVAAVAGTPSPGVAMLLGFIPGVGAMYNGQFMKGFIHVVIFVMLIVATSHEGLFGILIGFWVAYMAFDAYKTAEAKRLGLPLPDPLGLDRLFGLQEGQHAPAAATASPASAPTPGMATYAEPPPATSQNHVPVGAIVLIILGVVFLLGNFSHFDLHRFWPLILIGVGLWIAYKRTAMRA
jgi:TM2 domain-containing membrane protein YozV